MSQNSKQQMVSPRDLIRILAERGIVVAELNALSARAVDQLTLPQVVAMLSKHPRIEIDPKTGAIGIAPPQKVILLEAFFDRIAADQIKHIATRFNPTSKSKLLADNQKAIIKALNTPKMLEVMLLNLAPFERFALELALADEGRLEGWQLIAAACQSGVELPKNATVSSSATFYRQSLSSNPAARILGVMLRDGLLIPNSNGASWFGQGQSFQSAEYSPEEDRLFVDQRVLNALANLPRQPKLPVLPLNLPEVQAQPSAPHPARIMIELAEVMKLILEDGILALNKDGTFAKAGLTRLRKRRPWLEDRLEFYLEVMIATDLLVQIPENRSQSQKMEFAPNLVAWAEIYNAPLSVRFSDMLVFYMFSDFRTDVSPTSLRKGIADVAIARQGMIAALPLFPKHPVSLELALKALWPRIFRYYSTYLQNYFYREQTPLEVDTSPYFRHEILTTFHEFGILALEKIEKGSQSDKSEYVVAVGKGMEWMAQGIAFHREELLSETAPSGSQNNQNNPAEKCLLIQPNFEILAYLEPLSSAALEVLQCADCLRVDAQTATFGITRQSVYRYLEMGNTLETVLAALEQFSITPLPSNLRSSVSEWAGRRERITVTEHTILLEYHNQKERDTALLKIFSATPVGERFALVNKVPKEAVVHFYSSAPSRTIAFKPDGTFTLEGGSDLAARAAIAAVAKEVRAGVYSIDSEVVRKGQFNATIREALMARVKGKVPLSLEALLTLWEGKAPPPSMAPIQLFQHEYAVALSTHPALAEHFLAPLNSTTLPVKQGSEKALEVALSDLGIMTTSAFRKEVKAVSGQLLTPMQTGLDTRKMRVMIESAIEQKRHLDLKYEEEVTLYSRYGYPEKTKGKIFQEQIIPKKVVYSGSTPYFVGSTLEGNNAREIRIGYILGIAVI